MSVVMEGRARGASGVSFGVIVGEILPAALAVLLLAIVGVVHVTSRVMVVRMAYELSKLDSQTNELTRENDQLKLELATLKSPGRLEGLAKSQLGLAAPPASSVIHLKH